MTRGMDERTIAARIKGERTRALENIALRTDLPRQQWWLSFADERGFRGVVVVYAEGFTEALMEANLHDCNPHGECRGLLIPDTIVIPSTHTYRILNKSEAMYVDTQWRDA
jgi:hypothetical protein